MFDREVKEEHKCMFCLQKSVSVAFLSVFVFIKITFIEFTLSNLST